MKTIVTRAGRDRQFVAAFDAGTLYVTRGQWGNAALANEPCGQVKSDGTITEFSAAMRQVGFVNNSGQVFSGYFYGVHELIGTVEAANLFATSGELIAIADGADPTHALAAALTLGLLDAGDPRRRPLSGAGLIGSTLSQLPAALTEPEDREAPADDKQGAYPARERPNRPPPVRRPPPGGPRYLPQMTRKRWGRPFNPGDRVHVRKPLSDRGPGIIVAVSTELEFGMGTKVYPAFLVELDSGGDTWCSGTDLTKL